MRNEFTVEMLRTHTPVKIPLAVTGKKKTHISRLAAVVGSIQFVAVLKLYMYVY